MLSKFTIVLQPVVNLKSCDILGKLIKINPLDALSNSSATPSVAHISFKIA